MILNSVWGNAFVVMSTLLQFQWLPYFEATLGRDDLNISVNSSTPVINRSPSYIEKVFNKLNTKNKR